MRLVSLCSGYGGLDLAVEAVTGATTAAFSEVESAPAQVFARHWPDARPLGDLTAVDWTTVEADIVCAGFPCQDLSYAGKGRGIVADSRSGLWYAIEHALGVLRPRHVVLENVSAIVARRPGLDVVLAGLAKLGMSAQWTCIRASDVGAPHRRERWFLVARDTERAPEDARAAGRGPRRAVGESGRSPAADAVRAGAGRDGGGLSRKAGEDGWPGLNVRPARDGRQDAPDSTLVGRAKRWTEPDGRWSTACREGAAPDTESARRQGEPGEPHKGWPLVGTELGAGDRAGAGDSPSGVQELGRGERVAWGDYEPAVARWEHILGRPAPAPTDDRGRLSPPFVEWMMGLPTGWVTDTPGLSRSQQLKCLGNGVVPQQAAHALEQLLSRGLD